MFSITLNQRQQQANQISASKEVLSSLSINDNSGINEAIRSLRSNGISSFAIREALKETGLLEFEDEE